MSSLKFGEIRSCMEALQATLGKLSGVSLKFVVSQFSQVLKYLFSRFDMFELRIFQVLLLLMGKISSICQEHNDEDRNGSKIIVTRNTQHLKDHRQDPKLNHRLPFQQMDDLFPCKYLGKGLYGTTLEAFVKSEAVQEGMPRTQRFAQKLIPLKNLQEDYLIFDSQKIERVMSDPELKSSIVKVYAWSISKERSKMYMIMELMKKGDLFFHLCKLSGKEGRYFPEAAVKRVAYELLRIIENFHRLGLTYRNLRSENVFISNDSSQEGLVVSDFFFALNSLRSDTYYGAAEYAPPEVFYFEERQDSAVHPELLKKMEDVEDLIENVQEGSNAKVGGSRHKIQMKQNLLSFNPSQSCDIQSLARIPNHPKEPSVKNTNEREIRQSSGGAEPASKFYSLKRVSSFKRNQEQQTEKSIVNEKKILQKENSSPELRDNLLKTYSDDSFAKHSDDQKKKDKKPQAGAPSPSAVKTPQGGKASSIKFTSSLPMESEKVSGKDFLITETEENEEDQQPDANQECCQEPYSALKETDHSIDFWMLGVLLYELIYGKTPFESQRKGQLSSNGVLRANESKEENRTGKTHHLPEIQNNIKRCRVPWPKHAEPNDNNSSTFANLECQVGLEEKEFIGMLLQKGRAERAQAHDLMKHGFLQNVDCKSSVIELIYADERGGLGTGSSGFFSEKALWQDIKKDLKSKDNGLVARRNALSFTRNYQRAGNAQSGIEELPERLFEHSEGSFDVPLEELHLSKGLVESFKV